MDLKENLTTEQLRLKFKSQFELVNYSIRLAENMIKSGREPRVKIEKQSAAMQILAEIQAGKDQFDEIPETPPMQAQTERQHHYDRFDRHEKGEGKKKVRLDMNDDDDDDDDFADEKPKERKKGRKILSD